MKTSFLYSLLLIGFSTSALAAPTAITQFQYDNLTGMIDFNSVANEQVIDHQYNALGVNFNGALFGMSNSGDTQYFNGSNIASNWLYNGSGRQGSSWSVNFGSLQSGVGFFAETWPTDTVTLDVYRGVDLIGSLQFNSSSVTATYLIGAFDASGFDSLVVTTAVNQNGFFAMDNLKYAPAQVPVPGAVWLFASGLMALVAKRKLVA